MDVVDVDAMNAEILECARYGEHEELEEFLKAGADVNFADSQGNTCMHKAAANGEVECLKVLKKFGAIHSKNSQGNLPIHWATQNRKKGALSYLVENYDNIDMLDRNDMGISTLTDAFQSGEVDIIEVCLSHSSASEEKLIDTTDKNAKVKFEDESNEPLDSDTLQKTSGDDATEMEEANEKEEDKIENLEVNAVIHNMDLIVSADKSSARQLIKVRELPISRADKPFGSESAPEDDTTGLAIWPAAIILSRWIGRIGQIKPEMVEGKTVVELGAGCGLPGLAAAMLCKPAKVFITDIHHSTLVNAAFNARLNSAVQSETHANEKQEERGSNFYGSAVVRSMPSSGASSTDINAMDVASPLEQAPAPAGSALPPLPPAVSSSTTAVECLNVNWKDASSFPPGGADLLLGSDLVYESAILACLVPAVKEMLRPHGSFLYCAPDGDRDGMGELIEALATVDIVCVEHMAVPDYMYGNPLCEVDEDYFVLHFYDLAAKQPHSLYHFKHSEDTVPVEGASTGSQAS